MTETTQSDASSKQVLGILSTVFGGLSMVPFLGIVSPLGFILGVIGLFKDPKKLMAIIGTSISALGMLTSPVLWTTIACTLDSESCKTEEIANKTLSTIDDKYGEELGNEINKLGERLGEELQEVAPQESPAESPAEIEPIQQF
jgi:hypothetical protein